MQQQRRRQQQRQRGPNRTADRDEWEDLPLARTEPKAAAAAEAAGKKKAASPPVAASPRSSSSSQNQPNRPRPKRPQQKQPHNPAPQRKRSRSGGDSPAKAATTPAAATATTAAGRRSSKNTAASPLARASSVPAGYAPTAAPAAARTSMKSSTIPAELPWHQQKKKERSLCRPFSAGFCPSGANCLDIHDGRAVEERRTAWLRGGPLPDPQPAQWSLAQEVAMGRSGLYHGAPIASEVPPVLVIADVGNKLRVTEFVCLALEASTGRQLGRFARFVRVSPTAPPPPAAVAMPPPPQPMASQGLPPHQALQPFQQQQQQQPPLQHYPLPQQPQQQQQQQQLVQQPFLQALPQPLPFPGTVVVRGGIVIGNAFAAPVVVEGVANPLSSALPLPDLLQDLQQWMASLGLNPGPRDAAGFSERGNFRWVVTYGSGFQELPDLIGQHKLQLPDHLRSWTDAAKVCGWEASRENAHLAAMAANARNGGRGGGGGGGGGGKERGRSAQAGAGGGANDRRRFPKKHALPRSGLPGMLKFLGCPNDSSGLQRARRGMNTVESLAQCVVGMVRLGMPLPVTSRVTQVWGGAGDYAGSRHEQFPDESSQQQQHQQQVVVVGGWGAPVVIPNDVSGAAAGGAPAPLLLSQGVVGAAAPAHAPDQRIGFGGSAPAGMQQQQQLHQQQQLYQPQPQLQPQQQQQQEKKVKKKKKKKEASIQQWQNGTPTGTWGGPAGGATKGQHENGGVARGAGNGTDQRVPHWRQSVPVDLLAPDYLDFYVRERERQLYKSAAILPYRRDPVSGEVWILLGSEMRKNKLVVSCLGGKREDSDAGPEHTAWREFWEESGQVLGDHERASFLNACFEGRARAMWIQGAKMVVLACELDSPAFVSLPSWYACGGPGIDKGNTSMLALHWVSATELHHACHQRGGRVVVWGPPPPPEPEPAAVVAAAPQPTLPHQNQNQQQQWQQQQANGGGGRERKEQTPGLSRRERKLLAHQEQQAGRGGGAGNGDDGLGGGGGRGGGKKKTRRGIRTGTRGNALTPPVQPPMSSQDQQQPQQQQMVSSPPPIVPIPVEPYPLLKSLVADQAFQLFFSQLAAAGSSNQRFVPALNGAM